MQLAPSLHRLGNGLVNTYLLEESGEITIIDAGLPGYWKDLPGELAAMGRSCRGRPGDRPHPWPFGSHRVRGADASRARYARPRA